MYLIRCFQHKNFKAAKKMMVCAIFLEKEVMCNQPSTIQNLGHRPLDFATLMVTEG